MKFQDSEVVWNTKENLEKVRDSESSRQRLFGIAHFDCNYIKRKVTFSVKCLVRTELPDGMVLTLT